MLVPCTANVSVDITALSSAMPSNWVILLSLTASLVLLGAIRLALLWGSARTAVNSADKTEKQQHQPETKRSTFGIFTWESLPLNLPVTLIAPQNQVLGRGVGLGAGAAMSRHSSPPAPSPEMANKTQVNWQSSRGRQNFAQPPPSPYQPEVPISMAKMIMSRHTFRRPAQRPQRRSTSLPPSRPHSMV